MKLRWSSYTGNSLPLEQQRGEVFVGATARDRKARTVPALLPWGPASATFSSRHQTPPSRWKPLRHRAHCTPRCGTAVFVGRSGLSRRRSFTTLVVYTVSDTGGMEHSSSQNTLFHTPVEWTTLRPPAHRLAPSTAMTRRSPPPQRLPFSTLLPCFGSGESGSTSAQSSWWNIRRGGALRLAGNWSAVLAVYVAAEKAAHRDRHGNTRAFKVSIRSTETFIRALPTARQSAAPV
ncbi:hypothetical protein B0H15DRAFT_842688 [Mycena belliarum]|uniref:Uncharacterized protein n=1 Tax=Mycena belliarum TaxID=1033014 RepID=A0AAD6U269_9AGAR|nr:hypothetical protein B0H15DRAFT_842688 [Mycena belliae]